MKLRDPRKHLPPPGLKAVALALGGCTFLPGSADKTIFTVYLPKTTPRPEKGDAVAVISCCVIRMSSS